jgi:hypothetical protein
MPDIYTTIAADGCEETREATDVSTGVAEAGDIVALNPQGVIDETLLPPGVGAEIKAVLVAEDLDAGDYVNFFDDAGTVSVRPADNSNGRQAHGFVRTAFATGAMADVYLEGKNDALAALMPGETYFLGTDGKVTLTPPDLTDAATPVGTFVQPVGAACAATEISTEIGKKIRKG